MSSTATTRATDQWLLPILRDLLSEPAIQQLESSVKNSYWRTTVDSGLASDDDLLEALSTRTHFRVAADLMVSSEACERVPEKLARRFGILPLSISPTALDIAASNPYDLDCEKTLAFATGRAVRMSLAAPDRIMTRIEEVYTPVAPIGKLIDRATKSSVQSVIEKADDAGPDLDEKQAERPVIKLVD